jgi:hypothetical protein
LPKVDLFKEYNQNPMQSSLFKHLNAISESVLSGRNYDRESYARNILNYPAMMVPSVQEPIIEILANELDEQVSLIDPFMGASNTLVAGMKFGMNVFGQDINPLSILISQVKTCFYNVDELYDVQKELFNVVSLDYSNCIEVEFINIDKWFTKQIQLELSKIYRAIKKINTLKIRKFFWVVLAETVRLTSNDRTSTFKMHMRPIEEINSRQISALKTFFSVSNKNIKSISEYSAILLQKGQIELGRYKKTVDVVWGDTNSEIRTDKTFNLLVTSPPYGDNQTTVTYDQFSYLPLQWIPLNDIDEKIAIDYLRNAQSIDNKSLGGQIREHINVVEEKIFIKSATLKKFICQFDTNERKKAEKVTRFINDLDSSIDNMLPKMKKDSYLVWTIGNRNVNKQIVQNDIILKELFASKGIDLFTNLEREILSKRMPGRNNFSNMMSKEKILIFKKDY